MLVWYRKIVPYFDLILMKSELFHTLISHVYFLLLCIICFSLFLLRFWFFSFHLNELLSKNTLISYMLYLLQHFLICSLPFNFAYCWINSLNIYVAKCIDFYFVLSSIVFKKSFSIWKVNKYSLPSSFDGLNVYIYSLIHLQFILVWGNK